MAFAILAGKTKVYPVDSEALNVALRGRKTVMRIEVEITAANTDTTLTLATLAAAALAADGAGIITALNKAEKVLDYSFLESPRAAAASGAAHSYNGSKTNPVFTFAGGGTTPTALTLSMVVALMKDTEPFYTGLGN